MKTYKITQPVTKIYELEIESNITLPYGVIMELKNYINSIKVIPFTIDLTKQTITILKNYENEMSGLNINNLDVKGVFIKDYDQDVDDDSVEITGDFL